MSKYLKDYVKQYLVEVNLENALMELADDITIQDMIDALQGKLSKERFKKVGLGIFKFCSLGAIDAFDAVSDIGQIVDETGAIKDAILDSLIQKTGSLGIDGLIKKLKPKKKQMKRDPLNMDPYYSKIVDDKVENKFINDYIKYLEQNKNKNLKDFIKEEGDISSSFEKWLENSFEGRKLDTEKEDQDLYWNYFYFFFLAAFLTTAQGLDGVAELTLACAHWCWDIPFLLPLVAQAANPFLNSA